MKTPIVLTIALACAGLSPLHGGKTGEAEGFKPRVTHAELAGRRAAVPDPLKNHYRAKPLDPGTVQKRDRTGALDSLIARSVILTYRGFWTLVPKGSILHMPPVYEKRLSGKPVGKLLAWKDFHARNRGWIFTQPIKLENAHGVEALDEELLKNHRRLGRVVVAVLHNGPISVKTPVPPAAGPGPAAEESTVATKNQ